MVQLAALHAFLKNFFTESGIWPSIVQTQFFLQIIFS